VLKKTKIFMGLRFRILLIYIVLSTTYSTIMLRIKLSILITSFISTFGFSQSSLLYEISGKGLNESSYLFGTIHKGGEQVYQWNDSVLWALNASTAAAFEIDFGENALSKIRSDAKETLIEDWKDFMMKDLVPAMAEVMPADTLAKRLGGIYNQAFSAVSGMMGSSGETIVDILLQEYARKQGKEVIGVESVQEQLNVFLEVDKQMVKEKVIDFLKEDNWDFELDGLLNSESQLIESFASLESDKVCGILESQLKDLRDQTITSGLITRLYDRRNENMYSRVSKIMKEKSVFVAVGAGHMCGETGLLNQFRQAGYSVRPVNIATKYVNPISWKKVENDFFSYEVPQEVDQVVVGEYDYRTGEDLDHAYTRYSSKGKLSFEISIPTSMQVEMGNLSELQEAEEAEDYYESWKESKESKSKKEKKDKQTIESEEYFGEVMKGMMMYAMQSMTKEDMMAQMRQSMSTEEEEKEIEINGETFTKVCVNERGVYSETIVFDSDYGEISLTVFGDPMAFAEQDVNRFFKRFGVK